MNEQSKKFLSLGAWIEIIIIAIAIIAIAFCLISDLLLGYQMGGFGVIFSLGLGVSILLIAIDLVRRLPLETSQKRKIYIILGWVLLIAGLVVAGLTARSHFKVYPRGDTVEILTQSVMALINIPFLIGLLLLFQNLKKGAVPRKS